jgi:hypothetical protein
MGVIGCQIKAHIKMGLGNMVPSPNLEYRGCCT